MTAPTVRSGATTFTDLSSGTNHTINRPSTYSEGDFGIFVCCIDEGSGERDLTKPTEFDTVEYADQGVGSNAAEAEVWSITAGASEPSTYTCTSDASERATGIMFWVGGHNGIDVKSATPNTGSSITVTFPSVTTTVNDCLILRVLVFDVSSVGQIPVELGTGYTLIGENESASAGGVHIQYITQASAGATGTLAVDMGQSEQWAAWTIAIAPDTGQVVALNSLTLASSIESLSVTVAGAQTVGLSTLTLASSIPNLLASVVGGIPAISPIEFRTVARVLLANHFGQILADSRALLGPVSWRMNTHGKAKLTFARTDSKATELNLRMNNRVLIQFENGLPDWAGVIINRDWSESGVTVDLFGAEFILGFYRTDRGRYFRDATAGYIFKSVINEANTAYQTGIEAGSVYNGGTLHSPAYHLQSVYSIVKDSVCGRLSAYEFEVVPELVRGQIKLVANLYQKMGSRKPNVWLEEGVNANVESVSEQGPVINHWQVAGADVSGVTANGWGDGRLIVERIDEASRGKYGRVMDSAIDSSIENQGELVDKARFLLNETGQPRAAVCLTAYSRPPGKFADYRLGDSVRTILPSYTFEGVDDFYRILGRELDPVGGGCALVLENDHG